MRFLIVLLCVTSAFAGDGNRWKTNSTAIFVNTDVSYLGTGTSTAYPLGRDTDVLCDINIGNFDNSCYVTLTPVYELQGGNVGGAAAQSDKPSDEIILQNTGNVSTANYIRKLQFYKGASTLQFTCTTDNTPSTMNIDMKVFGYDDDEE